VTANDKEEDVFVKRRALALVRQRAKDSRNIAITFHAEDRMYERGISYESVLQILRSGDLVFEGLDENHNYLVKGSKLVAPPRTASVVCSVVIKGNRLVVITAMWEDMK
jgi:hypothetical protein